MKPVVCVANHTYRKDALPIAVQKMLLDNVPESKEHKLPSYFPFVAGMPVIITDNVNLELSLANGTRGTLYEVVYDPKDVPRDLKSSRFPADTV